MYTWSFYMLSKLRFPQKCLNLLNFPISALLNTICTLHQTDWLIIECRTLFCEQRANQRHWITITKKKLNKIWMQWQGTVISKMPRLVLRSTQPPITLQVPPQEENYLTTYKRLTASRELPQKRANPNCLRTMFCYTELKLLQWIWHSEMSCILLLTSSCMNKTAITNLRCNWEIFQHNFYHFLTDSN